MKRVLILMMLCGACTAPVRQDDGDSSRDRFSGSWESNNGPATLIETDLRPQREQDLETIGRNR
ncbi:MAG: hypothetical protein O3A95_03485 [Planctomycetota bacterium]|nr:hypothetical protein [Planctomycetota bacterium]MDA1113344.1 hypothetical protein [Planctomycetota bacterium]